MRAKILLPLTVALTLTMNACRKAPVPVPFGVSEPPGSDVAMRDFMRRTATRATEPLTVDCSSPKIARLWEADYPADGGKAFAIDADGALKIIPRYFTPSRTTAKIFLPGDALANGDVWAERGANYISFQCRADGGARLTFHLLKRNQTTGTFTAGVTVGGDWQRVILPLSAFGLESFADVAGFGVRLASPSAAKEILLKDFAVGGTKFNDYTASSFSISGDWRFATDSGNSGEKEKWFAEKFDDSRWRLLNTGKSWQEQGVNHSGWGWYRQKFVTPGVTENMTLTVQLPPIAADDDVWINGRRVGGLHGEYKYANMLPRVYTVPPSVIKPGGLNTLAVRVWGGNLTFIGDKSGLVGEPQTLRMTFDHGAPLLRGADGEAAPIGLFDLSDTQRGMPFEILFSFPRELAEKSAAVSWRLEDYLHDELASGSAPLTVSGGAVVAVGAELSQKIYLRGRFRARLIVTGADGEPLYAATREFDRLNFAKRDNTPLPPLAETFENTPYGKLKLVDEIDCATPLTVEPHPYMESGFDHAALRMTPGSAASVTVSEILGKQARECGFGWFAYRVGRGKLKPHATYLARIEYPEDKPRYAPVEIQTGQNYMDLGWKNGVAADDPYDNWPLSKKWEWYDVMVALDDETVSGGGTNSGAAENGFWIYFLNKVKPDSYNSMWSGGPAVARVKLYEIDAGRDAPKINYPQNAPRRVLAFDWERLPDGDPDDVVRYAKLMGYNAVSPIILKWHFMNLSDPLDGYSTGVIDPQNYWSHEPIPPAPGRKAASPLPVIKSPHALYLEATKRLGIGYLPRFEYGGSAELPEEARAIGADGQPAKPSRFAAWSANLLHPATWDDLQKLLDHLLKPHAADNPQLLGALWRIRCDRMPVSYSDADLQKFAADHDLPVPARERCAAGDLKTRYEDWWHRQRAEFHRKLAALARSYRDDLNIYYYNWDGDKFCLVEPDATAWAFISQVVAPGGGRAVYERDRALRKKITAADYIAVMRGGDFGKAAGGRNAAHYAIRPELYRDIGGFQIFAPANHLCYADKADYLNYFQTAEGLAVSNAVPYDEIRSRSINPKYECNELTPAGAPFSMAVELLAWFHGDARTLTRTSYTHGRGFADAHRRFAQAFLALPAAGGADVDQKNADVKVRTYATAGGTYVGVAHKGYAGKTLTVKIPNVSGTVVDLVTNRPVPATVSGGGLQFTVSAGPMQLNAYLIQ